MKRIISFALIMTLIFTLAVVFPFKVSAATLGRNVEGIKAFHGKWVSNRVVPDQDPIHKTLKIRCNQKNYCKMDMIVEESKTCTANFGEPTDALLTGGSYVEINDWIIEFFVDAYCLTKPPSYSFSFPVFYTYNPSNDTLQDSLGVIWYRK